MQNSLIVRETIIQYPEQDLLSSELIPLIWNALEEIVKPSPEKRNKALDELGQIDAPQTSPVVAYILATHLVDPDMAFRVRAIKVLGNAISPGINGRGATENVRAVLMDQFSQFRTRQVFSILQALSDDPSIIPEAVNILDACRFSGNHLLDILQDADAPYPIRSQAANMLGQVGCIDAIPMLERILHKIQNRLNQQSKNAFPTQISNEETDLLSAVKNTLDLLKAP